MRSLRLRLRRRPGRRRWRRGEWAVAGRAAVGGRDTRTRGGGGDFLLGSRRSLFFLLFRDQSRAPGLPARRLVESPASGPWAPQRRRTDKGMRTEPLGCFPSRRPRAGSLPGTRRETQGDQWKRALGSERPGPAARPDGERRAAAPDQVGVREAPVRVGMAPCTYYTSQELKFLGIADAL